jgi:hypothetical protein
MLSVVMLSDAILWVIMPNVIMQSVVLLSVFQCHRYEWRYTERCYAEYGGAIEITTDEN